MAKAANKAPTKRAPRKPRVTATIPPPPPVVETPQQEERDPKEEPLTRPASTQEATGTAPARSSWLQKAIVFVTVKKWPLYVLLGLIALIAALLFAGVFNPNHRIVKQNDKQVAKIENSLEIKKKQQDSIELAEWRQRGAYEVGKAFVAGAEEEVKQSLRNKQITDEQAEQIRTKIKSYSHEIEVKINDAPIRVLDSLRDVFLLARKLNKDAVN